MAKNELRDFLFYAVFGILAIYGFFAFIQPDKYPIPQTGAYSGLVGLILMIVGIGIILKGMKK